MPSVAVFCVSSEQIDERYKVLAAEVGFALARRGWTLVSGGGSVSSMGALARAARAGGAHTIGVIPRALVEMEVADHGADELVVTDDMRERKGEMDRRSDAFITLPGGIGTLEEAVETLSWAKLSLHRKPMAFLSENNYWGPYFNLIDHMIEGGFLPESFRQLMADTNSPEAALDALHQRAIVLD